MPARAATPFRRASRLGLALACALALPATASEPTEGDELFDLSFEELLEVTITTASRTTERAVDAPATVIVLTGEELRRRGYRELSEIYDDLPGMDVSRSYGDTWYRNQWRGLRKSIGSPYLLMLDGVIQNHLYFNQEEIIAALPMSHIAQVEIVYGPGSAVYGPNAFVGVVNVITRQQRDGDGQSLSGRATLGDFDTRIADVHWLAQRGNWRLSLAARLARGDLDDSREGSYEWLRETYLANRQLWGGLADRYGRYSSEHTQRGIDLRVFHGDTEVAVQHFELDTGFGLVYAADRIPMLSSWIEPDTSVHLRQPWTWGEAWRGTWLLRWRESGVEPDSDTVEGFNALDPQSRTLRRLVNISNWGVETSSVSLFNDAEWTLSPQFSVLAGLKHERKDLQKAYRIVYGPSLPPGALPDFASYPYPPEADTDTVPRNRIDTRDSAVYALGRWRLGGDQDGALSQHLLAGVRFDRNSEYGTARTLRGGYVLGNAPWTFKLLYGESFNEPAPRELYGGWSGSGSNPTLDPETARTLEASVTWQQGATMLLASVYQLRSDDNISTFSGGARNLGERRIEGIDLHASTRLPVGEPGWTLWAYYSYIEAEESVPDGDGRLQGMEVGDTAPHKLHVGITAPFGERTSATLRARWIDARETVASNPLGEVPGYATADLSLTHRDWPRRGIGWQLTVSNLLDRDYHHPGLREGDAGFTPGSFDAGGVWRGSAGYYSSLLPQPGRGVFVSMLLDF